MFLQQYCILSVGRNHLAKYGDVNEMSADQCRKFDRLKFLKIAKFIAQLSVNLAFCHHYLRISYT